MAKDVHAHIHSCSVCQKCDKQGPRLVPMVDRGILTDWVDALSLVMYAIRLHDHDGLGVSPYELVHDHQLVHDHHGRTELDLLYAGWRKKKFEALEV